MPLMLAQSRTGEGEPLVLLHGIGTSRMDFAHVLPLLGATFDAAALDLPGHGGSAPLPGRPTAAAIADAVEAHLDGLGWGTAHVLGNSLGGRIALELAMRHRTRSVMAIAPAGTSLGLERTLQVAMLGGTGVLMHAMRPFVDCLANHPSGRAVLLAGMRLRPDLATPAEAASVGHNAGTAAYWDTLLWATAWDLVSAARLAQIRCPVLLAQGAVDGLIGTQVARYAMLIPGATTTVLPWAGHTAHGDVPTVVATLMARTAASTTSEPAR